MMPLSFSQTVCVHAAQQLLVVLPVQNSRTDAELQRQIDKERR